MQVNAEFDKRVVVDTSSVAWIDSPVSDVRRKMLDRVGDEVARATSIVQYQSGSSFPTHVHGGGEEIFVLEGTFSDEFGDYPAGTYLRNPPGSSHQPSSQSGCTLFVKLWQFVPGDQQTVRVDTNTAQWYEGLVPGLFVMPLHEYGGVNTALVRWAPNTQFNRHVHPGGEEILVLEGTFYDEHDSYQAGSWLRSPCYSEHRPFTKTDGALIYVKTGHLGAPCVELPVV